MCGRKPRYKSIRQLALSYFETYVHLTGRLVGYATYDLDDTVKTNWRTGEKNCWKLNQALVDLKHTPVHSSDARYEKLHWKYLYFKVLNPDKPVLFYKNKRDWL
jgi:hypothetical protein